MALSSVHKYFSVAYWRKIAIQTRQDILNFLSSHDDVKAGESLRNHLGKLILLRIVIISGILGVIAWNTLHDQQSVQQLQLFFWAIGSTFGLSLINTIWLRWTKHLQIFGYGQLLLDVFLATVAVYLSGGSMSPFVFIYFLVIMNGAIVLGHFAAIVIAGASGLCYALLSSGLIVAAAGQVISASPQHILSVYLSLLTIAVVSGFVSRQLHSVWQLARSNEKDARDLSHQKQSLFDDISEGMINLDIDLVITGINRAATAILGLSQLESQQIIGKTFDQVFRGFGVEEPQRLLENGLEESLSPEVTLSPQQLDRELLLTYAAHVVTDSEGKETGKVLMFRDLSHLRNMERRLSLHEEMTKLLSQQEEVLHKKSSSLNRVQIIGDSPVMHQVLSLIERVGASDASVLITGESGSGKELIARAIHLNSSRANKPFVAINCGAIPENLIESELFGHKKGAFTGASMDNPGLFRQANGGTLFLDEIGELPLNMQTKLLRVLQEKSIRSVGAVNDVPVDVRLLSATNRDLKHEVSSHRFREDLYYRLNVVNIYAPPLRERREDIPQLVRFFIGKLSDPNKVLPQISPEALSCLSLYGFPGNVRELENIIERAIVLGGQAILPEHLPEEVRHACENTANMNKSLNGNKSSSETEIHLLPVDLESELAKLEQHYLIEALQKSGGIKTQAAHLLGLNFRSLRYRLKKYNLSDDL